MTTTVNLNIRRLVTFASICLIVGIISALSISYFNKHSLSIIQHIELTNVSPYQKAQLVYQVADLDFVRLMKEVGKLNKEPQKTVLISTDDELLTRTLTTYLTAQELDPSSEFSSDRRVYYERIAQIYDVCGMGYKRFEYMARALVCDGNFKMAEVYAGTAAAANISDATAWKLLVEIYLGLGSFNYATIACDQVLKAGAPQWEVASLNGKISLHKNDLQSAKQYLIESLQLNPNQVRTRLMMADILEGLSETTAAITMLEDGLVHGVDKTPIALHRLATLSLKEQQYDKAVLYFDSCVKQEPNNAGLRIQYAEALKRNGAPQYLINEQLQKAYTINPKLQYLPANDAK